MDPHAIRLPDHAALLLDLDGTLLDFAPTPDAVVVPAGLADTLLALRAKLDDALAIVTGRPLEQIDALLPGVPRAVAGEHGAVLRVAPGAPVERPNLPSVPDSWRDAARLVAEESPGALLEPKARGFVLHFRRAPESGARLRDALLDIMASGDAPAEHFALLGAHMAWEIRPRGADKGTAVARLLREEPFAGRVPVYIGDDITDEDGMRVARAHGGLGWRVQDVFGDPAGVRAWLEQLARR